MHLVYLVFYVFQCCFTQIEVFNLMEINLLTSFINANRSNYLLWDFYSFRFSVKLLINLELVYLQRDLHI